MLTNFLYNLVDRRPDLRNQMTTLQPSYRWIYNDRIWMATACHSQSKQYV